MTKSIAIAQSVCAALIVAAEPHWASKKTAPKIGAVKWLSIIINPHVRKD